MVLTLLLLEIKYLISRKILEGGFIIQTSLNSQKDGLGKHQSLTLCVCMRENARRDALWWACVRSWRHGTKYSLKELPAAFICCRIDHADGWRLVWGTCKAFSVVNRVRTTSSKRDKRRSSLPQHRVFTTIPPSDKLVSHWKATLSECS